MTIAEWWWALWETRVWCKMKLCDVYLLLSNKSWSHYYWHAIRNGSILSTRSWWGNNGLCITTARDVKSLHMLTSSTTHGRTLKKSHGSGTQLPYSVWGGWEWLTLANNYWRWKLDPFYKPERKSAGMVWKKKRKKCRKNSRLIGPPSRWC